MEPRIFILGEFIHMYLDIFNFSEPIFKKEDFRDDVVEPLNTKTDKVWPIQTFFDMGQHFRTFHHCWACHAAAASQLCHRLTESNLDCLPSFRLKKGLKASNSIA